MPAAKWGRFQRSLSRAVKWYPLSDSYLKEGTHPLFQLQNLNINAFHASFLILPVHHLSITDQLSASRVSSSGSGCGTTHWQSGTPHLTTTTPFESIQLRRLYSTMTRCITGTQFCTLGANLYISPELECFFKTIVYEPCIC